MLHKNHVKTSIATASASSFLFITSPYNLIYFIFMGVGGYIGQTLGPDLDIEGSKPNKIGGKQILVLITSIMLILSIGISKWTIITLLLSTALLGVKISFKWENYILNFVPLVLIFFISIINLKIIDNPAVYFGIFTFILIKKNKHRGATHSLLILFLTGISGFLLVTSTNSSVISIVVKALFLGYIIGFVTHIIMDLLGSKPVQFYYPSKKMVKPLKIYKIGKKENLVANITIGLCVVLSILIIYFQLN